MKRLTPILFIIGTLATGCAATVNAPLAKTNDMQGRTSQFKVYRNSPLSYLIRIKIYQDSQLVGKLRPFQTLKWSMPAGAYDITAQNRHKNVLRLDAQPGQKYYMTVGHKLAFPEMKVVLRLKQSGKEVVALK